MKPPLRSLFAPIMALALLSGCGKSPDELVASARKDFAAENYQQARLDALAALEDRPADRDLLLLLADIHLRLGDAEGAQGVVGRIERLGGPPAPPRIAAEIALLRGDARQALVLAGDDPSADAARIRAEAHLALGDEDAARAAFRRGMAATPDLRLAAAYGRFLLHAGELDDATGVLRTLRKLAPGSYEAIVMQGDLASARGRDTEAMAAYRKAIAAYPDRVAPLLALANLHDAAGDVEQAMKLVEQAGDIAPADPAVEQLWIQLLSEKGEWEKIRQALQSRESQLDAGSALSMTYAEALLRLGHAEQARILFTRAVLVEPANPYARLMLGEAQLATGDAEGAWETLAPLAAGTLARPEVLETALKAADAVDAPEAPALRARLQPGRIKATMALAGQGDAALARRDWAGAEQVYARLLASGEDAEVLRRLALAKLRLGKAAEAMSHADRAVELRPDDPECLRVAAGARLAAGREPAAAVRLLESAAAAAPRDETIRRELEKARATAG